MSKQMITIKCDACGGSGEESDHSMMNPNCSLCLGKGFVELDVEDMRAHYAILGDYVGQQLVNQALELQSMKEAYKKVLKELEDSKRNAEGLLGLLLQGIEHMKRGTQGEYLRIIREVALNEKPKEQLDT